MEFLHIILNIDLIKKTIEKLLEIKWWDWDYEKIYDAIPLLQSGEVDQLINEASKDDVVAFND